MRREIVRCDSCRKEVEVTAGESRPCKFEWPSGQFILIDFCKSCGPQSVTKDEAMWAIQKWKWILAWREKLAFEKYRKERDKWETQKILSERGG